MYFCEPHWEKIHKILEILVQEITLNKEGLKFSFFKLDLLEESEINLYSHYNKLINEGTAEQGRLACSAVFGLYDNLCVIRKSDEKKIQKGGTISGVQAFSEVDCYFDRTQNPSTIIQNIRKFKCTMFISATLRPDELYEHGIFVNLNLNKFFLHDEVFFAHGRSLSWGEQILILCTNSIQLLLELTRKLMLDLKNKTLDTHTILTLSSPFVSGADENKLNNDILGDNEVLEWEIQIKRGLGGCAAIYKQMSSLADGNKNIPTKYSEASFSVTGDKQIYRFTSGARWSDILKLIRHVRYGESPSIIGSTLNLRFLDWKAPAPPVDSRFVRLIKIEKNILLKRLVLRASTIERIQKNLGWRVGYIVVQAIYTVYDAASQFPKYYLMRQLVHASITLFHMAISKPGSDSDKNKLIRNCQGEALDIMNAVRQRLSGIPVTREGAKTAFETPPPSLRIHYEALEYIPMCILSLFEAAKPLGSTKAYVQDWIVWPQGRVKKIQKPYIMVTNNLEAPGHKLLKIYLPEHRISDIANFSAISHEAMHHYATWLLSAVIDDLRVQENLKRICSLPSLSQGRSLNKLERLVHEFLVEILNFEITYLSNINKFIKGEWCNVLYRLLTSRGPTSNTNDHLYIHIVRLFVVVFWSDLSKNNILGGEAWSINRFKNAISDSSSLRGVIREKFTLLRNITKEFISYHHRYLSLVHKPENIKLFERHLSISLSNDKISNIQFTLQNFSETLSVIFERFWDLFSRTSIRSSLSEMKNSLDSIDDLANNIMDGRVQNVKIQFPHLLVQAIFSKLLIPSKTQANYKIHEKITTALLLTLWNAWNIFEFERVERLDFHKERSV